jgi:hypothetical protein
MPEPQSGIVVGNCWMSDLSLERTKIKKTICAVLAELVIIIGSFVLFSSRFDLHAFGAFAPVLVIGYPFAISICTGIVVVSTAEMKHMASWKWGGLTAAMTLFLIMMLVTLPSFMSVFAFLIAPVVAIAISRNVMNAQQTNQSS